MLKLTPLGLLGMLLIAATSRAQETPRLPPPATAQSGQDDETIRFRLPTVSVTAQKESENVQDLPVSVTAVTSDTLEASGVRSISEAAQFAPNTFFSEFTARKLSNPRFRGVGASPSNPGVTTYIDGVPQLNANSSSIELIGVQQIEFVRGPQSALFGRNALGGLINITSARPSLKDWTGAVTGPYGNFSWGDVRGTAAGPLVADKLALGVGVGYSGRDGFTKNDVTGHDLDSRSAVFAKVQLLWVPAARWEVRGILNGERARDGDYALNDLGALRAKPFHVLARFRGVHPSRYRRADRARQPCRQRGRLFLDDRLRLVEDGGSHRSRLHPAAAHHPQQQRKGPSVHAGIPVRLRKECGRRAG